MPSQPVSSRVVRLHADADAFPIIDLLRADGVHMQVVDLYIAPLWGVLRPWPASIDAMAMLRAIRNVLGHLSNDELQEVYALTIAERTVWPNVAGVRKLATRALGSMPTHVFTKGDPEYALWIAHWRSMNHIMLVRNAESLGYVRVRSAIPPTRGRP